MLELKIEKLTHGGRGMGRHDGKAVFVPLTCPGDLVRCRVTRDKGRYAEALLEELIIPSGMRRMPPCPLFGECGGCQWQHLPYPVQCDGKEQIFMELLARRQLLSAEAVAPLLAAPGEFAYRSRVQFKCRMTDHGLAIGFYRSGSHFVVDAASCLLVAPPIQKVLAHLREALATAPAADAIPQIDICCGDGDEALVVMHGLPAAAERHLPWLESVARSGGFSAFLQPGRKDTLRQVHGSPNLLQRVGTDRVALRAGPGSFTQVNCEQNDRLVDLVIAAADLQGHERVLDLFCGIGNFSLPLARRAAEVVGVEDFAPAIEDARRNALDNGLANVHFQVGDACRAAQHFREGRGFDLVVLDPPRSGCYAVMKALLQLMPRRIIYVSCDPATLARDLQLMVHNGYVAARSQVIDLFPQTWHIESVTVLDRER
jgi:23S rRNA (uracil1939-C5)-methyltransferase